MDIREFCRRRISITKKRLCEYYSDDNGKTEYYFQEKGYLKGVLYAYENILDLLEEADEIDVV